MTADSITLTPAQLGDLLVCATHYSLGRPTYVSEVVPPLLVRFARVLPAGDRETLIRDIRRAGERREIHDMDAAAWARALGALEAA